MKKYKIIGTLAPGFTTFHGQRYIMPGWIPVDDSITFNDIDYVNPYLKETTTYIVEGSNGNKYNVTVSGSIIKCDCPAGRFRGKCKHSEQIKTKIKNE